MYNGYRKSRHSEVFYYEKNLSYRTADARITVEINHGINRFCCWFYNWVHGEHSFVTFDEKSP